MFYKIQHFALINVSKGFYEYIRRKNPATKKG